MTRDKFISAEEVCGCLRLNLATVYERARTGEIPGAVWGETLRFKREEFIKWWQSKLEEAFKTLGEKGFISG